MAVQTRSLELHPLADQVESRTTAIYEEMEQSSVSSAVIKAVLFLVAVSAILTTLLFMLGEARRLNPVEL